MTRITLRDEAALTRYFCHWQHRFQRSVHGAMVERLERDSMGSRRCVVCGGSGLVETEEAIRQHSLRHLGMISTKRTVAVRGEDLVWTTRDEHDSNPVRLGDYCQVCGGSGWTALKRRRTRCECHGSGPRGRSQCRSCLGTGVPQVTARQVCTAHESGGAEVDGDTLKAYAEVNRRLASVPAGHRQTLERYYGPHGQSWASEPGGRLLGLQEFTAAGRRLIGKTRTKGDDATGASKAERIAAQWDLQRTQPAPWRQTMLDQARDQAQAAISAAQDAFAGSESATLAESWSELGEALDATGDRYAEWIDRNWTDGVGLGVPDDAG